MAGGVQRHSRRFPGQERRTVCETLTPAGSTVGLGFCGLRAASFVACSGQWLWVFRLLSCFSVGRGWAWEGCPSGQIPDRTERGREGARPGLSWGR